jgi:uncharacterized protein (TIGR01244 family)
MSISIQRLDADVSVAPQLAPESMAEAAAAGFRSVINNRPDFEGGPTQPTHAAIEAAARGAGLTYVFLPVAGNYQSEEEITRFGALIASLPKPILAFCRTGTRSGKLWQAATAR